MRCFAIKICLIRETVQVWRTTPRAYFRFRAFTARVAIMVGVNSASAVPGCKSS